MLLDGSLVDVDAEFKLFKQLLIAFLVWTNLFLMTNLEFCTLKVAQMTLNMPLHL